MARHQSTSPQGVRRASEGYPKGLEGRYGGSAGPGLGWQRRGAREIGGEWIGLVAPTAHSRGVASQAVSRCSEGVSKEFRRVFEGCSKEIRGFCTTIVSQVRRPDGGAVAPASLSHVFLTATVRSL